MQNNEVSSNRPDERWRSSVIEGIYHVHRLLLLNVQKVVGVASAWYGGEIGSKR